MGDRLQYVKGRNYQRIDNGLGISFQLDYGFRVDYEHVFKMCIRDRGRTLSSRARIASSGCGPSKPSTGWPFWNR